MCLQRFVKGHTGRRRRREMAVTERGQKKKLYSEEKGKREEAEF